MADRLARLISVLTHPMWMVTWGLLIYLKVNPFAFGVYQWTLKWPLLLMVFVLTFFFPALVIFLLRRLGFIDSYEMQSPRERIIPYIATSVFYLWLYVTTKSNPEIPALFKAFTLGSVISLFLVFFINNFSKISAHMAGLGGLLMSVLVLSYQAGSNDGLGFLTSRPQNLPSIILLLSGLTGSARLSLGAHKLQEVAGGFVVGLLGQLIALKFYF